MNIFHHSGSLGDIIYALPAIKATGGGTLFIEKEQHYNLLKRLLELQSYIIDVKLGRPEDSYIDLDKFRDIYNENPTWHLARCHLAICNVSFNLRASWLEKINPNHIADIVINRTEHYHDKNEIDWRMLKDHNTVFIGHDNEYDEFIKIAGFKPKRFVCNDVLDIAMVIKGSKMFFGNQSLGFALAEAMKHPRVLEVCYAVNNCQPQSLSGYTKIYKDILEGYLYNHPKMHEWVIVDRLTEIVLDNVPGCIVEIGIGQSTPILAKYALAFRRRHYACDIAISKWNNMVKYGIMHEYMHKYHCSSFSFMKLFRDRPAVVFIDGNHKYDVVSKEAEFFIDKLVPGGVAFFHDMYNSNIMHDRYVAKEKNPNTWKCRVDLERRDDIYTMTFPYTAGNMGLTVVLKKEKERPFYRQ